MSEEYSTTAGSEGEDVSAIRTLDVENLVSGKYQPRTRFSDEYLKELAESITKNGIMQPIIVRPTEQNRYEIIAGERRWRAAKLAGLAEVPVIVREIDDRQALELALVENIQRQDLNPFEEAQGYRRLMDEFAYTQEQLSSAVGKSRSHIANLLRLLTLPEAIRDPLIDGTITMGHARALLSSDDPTELVGEVIRRGLNVRQTEALAKGGIAGLKKPAGPRSASQRRATFGKAKDPDILALEETLSENLGLQVSIEDNGKDGQIIISYESLSQLDNILKRLGGAI